MVLQKSIQSQNLKSTSSCVLLCQSNLAQSKTDFKSLAEVSSINSNSKHALNEGFYFLALPCSLLLKITLLFVIIKNQNLKAVFSRLTFPIGQPDVTSLAVPGVSKFLNRSLFPRELQHSLNEKTTEGEALLLDHQSLACVRVTEKGRNSC